MRVIGTAIPRKKGPTSPRAAAISSARSWLAQATYTHGVVHVYVLEYTYVYHWYTCIATATTTAAAHTATTHHPLLNNYLISTSRTRTPVREQERGL
jgi:hypothetical protein